MSLRDDLISAGLEDAQAKIAEAVLKAQIAGEYIPKHRFDEVNEKNKELAKSLTQAEADKAEAIKRAEKAEGEVTPLQEQLQSTKAEWEKKYQDLEEKHKQEEEDRQTLETFNARMNAIKSYLGETVYDTDMVSSLIDLEGLKVENGKVSGVKEAVEAIKKDKPFLFKPEEKLHSTAPTSAPNKGGSEKVNFGELLAKKAQAVDELTQAATEKYFGKNN